MMKAILFGVGRSGTTALYRLLQEIMEDTSGAGVDYVYEPFLWDREAFDGKYAEVDQAFQYVRSVSVEGMYHHKQLPLFIEDSVPYRENEYVRSLFRSKKKGNHLLAKFIRANGRYRLLRDLCPEGKFIFVVRNPVDVVNSAINLFSFFGDDFYRSDFPRFAQQVQKIYGVNIPDTVQRVEREVLYWYYMNRFALESFEGDKDRPLILCYESFVKDKPRYIRQICEYCGWSYKDSYGEILRNTVGYSSGQIHISEDEYSMLARYLDEYAELLKTHGIENGLDAAEVQRKYADRLLPGSRVDECYGYTTLAMRNYYRRRLSEERKQRQG